MFVSGGGGSGRGGGVGRGPPACGTLASGRAFRAPPLAIRARPPLHTPRRPARCRRPRRAAAGAGAGPCHPPGLVTRHLGVEAADGGVEARCELQVVQVLVALPDRVLRGDVWIPIAACEMASAARNTPAGWQKASLAAGVPMCTHRKQIFPPPPGHLCANLRPLHVAFLDRFLHFQPLRLLILFTLHRRPGGGRQRDSGADAEKAPRPLLRPCQWSR